MILPATLLYLQRDVRIVKEEDYKDIRHKDWLVRCVPNLYPAFTPPSNDNRVEVNSEKLASWLSLGAFGHLEVIIESPRHDEHLVVA